MRLSYYRTNKVERRSVCSFGCAREEAGSAGPSAKAQGLKKIEKKVLPSFEIRKFTVMKELNWN